MQSFARIHAHTCIHTHTHAHAHTHTPHLPSLPLCCPCRCASECFPCAGQLLIHGAGSWGGLGIVGGALAMVATAVFQLVAFILYTCVCLLLSALPVNHCGAVAALSFHASPCTHVCVCVCVCVCVMQVCHLQDARCNVARLDPPRGHMGPFCRVLQGVSLGERGKKEEDKVCVSGFAHASLSRYSLTPCDLSLQMSLPTGVALVCDESVFQVGEGGE